MGRIFRVRILILTSKDHLYANAVLGRLIRARAFDGHSVAIHEQDSVVPGKSKFAGLARYFGKSGARYVAFQIAKQYLFHARRAWALRRGERNSPFFPYFALTPLERETVNGLRRADVRQKIAAYAPELILSVFSKEIIPPEVLAIPPAGTVNLHPSLLPAYRGVSPVFWCLAEGAPKTGATLHYVDAGIDTGPMISQRELAVDGERTEHALYLKLCDVGAELLLEFLARAGGGRLPAIAPREEASYRSLPTAEAVARFLAGGHRFFTPAEFK
jgi:folate-dependent phosphoribosylglycinamide formyltransferase PurN